MKCRRTPPLGPLPNEDIDLSNPESIERYRSYTRYLRQAEEAKNQPAWWKTYKGYMEQADPDHGETEGEAVSCGFLEDVNGVIKTASFPTGCRYRACGHWAALPPTTQDHRGKGEETGDEGKEEEC